MVKWFKKISAYMIVLLCSGLMLVGCGDLYSRLDISLSHSGGVENKVEMTYVEGAECTYEITATVTGLKKGVSDKIRYEIQNGSNLTVTDDYKGDGKTVLTITATSHGKSTLTISTVEGNKSKNVEIIVYKKVEAVAFSTDKLAIRKNGTLNLNNYISYTPADTNQTEMTYGLVRVKDENDNEFVYSSNYAKIKNGILTVDENATLPIDPETNLPYVSVVGISAFNESITTEVINIPIIEQVELDSIALESNSNNGQVTLVKNSNGVYHVVLASNVGFTDVAGTNSVLFKRRLSFKIGNDADEESKYDVFIPEKYLESYQLNNPNLTEEEKAEIANYPVLITKLDSSSMEHIAFDVTQKQIGEITIPFTIKYMAYEGLPDIEIVVKFEVLAFPTEITAMSGNQVIEEGNPLKVLNLYSNNLNGTPLTITTNNDNVSTRLYFTFKIDKGTAPTNSVSVASSNPTNKYTENTNIHTGSTIYLYHEYSSEDVESIENAYIVITYTYDLNPESITGTGEGAVIGNFAYSIEKKIPLTFRAGIDTIPLLQDEFRIDASKPQEIKILETTLGVYANEFTYTANTNLFTLRIEKTETFIVPNKDGLSGEYTLVIRDTIRNLYRACKVVVYVPFAFVEDNTMFLKIDNENNYKDEILDRTYEDKEVSLITASEVELKKTYSTLTKLTLQVNSSIPINAFNYILNPEFDSAEVSADDNLDLASEKYVKLVNINHYLESVDIPYKYGTYKNGVLSVGNNIYTNTESPLIVNFIFTGYNAEGVKVTLKHKVELLIYSLINNLNVTVSNPNIYEYNSVGALNLNKATSTLTITNVLNNASTVSFEVINKTIKTFHTIHGEVSFNITDLFTINYVENSNFITLISKPTGSIEEVDSGVSKLNSLLSDYGTINNILQEIYATNFDIEIVVTLTQFNRRLSTTVTIGTIYAIKSERIILNNVNSTGLYFDIRDLSVGDKKDISFSIEPSNAFNKNLRLIYDANNVFNCEMLNSNVIRIYPNKAGVSTLRLAFEDSYEEVEVDGSLVLMPTKYIEIRVKVADGSQLYPFEISSVDDFKNMLRDINNGANSYNYVLTNSINLSSFNYSVPTTEFNGSLNGLFEYQLDDNEYSIQNSIIGLTINVTENDILNNNTNIGLFGELTENATIKNLNIVDAVINISKTYSQKLESLNVGIIAGTSNGVIKNSRVTGNIYVKAFADNMNVGGLVGFNDNGIISGLPSINSGLGNSDINSIVNIKVDRILSIKDLNNVLDYVDVIDDVTSYLNVGSIVGESVGKFRYNTLDDVADLINLRALSNIKVQALEYTVELVDTEINETYTLNTDTFLINVGGAVGYSITSKIKDVLARVGNITAINLIGGIAGALEDSLLENGIVQFVNMGYTGISASNIVGYSHLGALVGITFYDTEIKYSYARNFYNKLYADIDNVNYFGNIVSLTDGGNSDDIIATCVGGLVGASEFANLTISNCYSIVDINVSPFVPATVTNKDRFSVGGFIGFVYDGMLDITNSFAFNNIKMPESIKQTNTVTVTVENNSEEGGASGSEGGEGSGEGSTPGITEETKTIEIPTFEYFVGGMEDVIDKNVSTNYAVVNYNKVNDSGFFAFVDKDNNVTTSEEVIVESVTDDEGNPFDFKYLMGKSELINNLNEENGFKITDDAEYNKSVTDDDYKLWYVNSLLNEGFPVLFDANHEVMYTVLPSSIIAEISEESSVLTNNSHIKVSNNKLILFYNKLTSGVEYFTNNTYKIVLDNSGSEINTLFNNVITISLGIDPALNGIAKLESSIIIESSNPNIVEVQNGNTLKTMGVGQVTLTIYSALDTTIRTSVEIMVVAGISDFNLYKGSTSDVNKVVTEEQLVIDKVNKYNVDVVNKFYFNGINGVFTKNSDLGYLIYADENNIGTLGIDTTSTGELIKGNTYFFNSLGYMNLIGFTSGKVSLTLTPFIKTGSSEFGKDLYLDENRVLTDEEVEIYTTNGSIENYTKISGIVIIDKLQKDYNFEIIEKAKSLSLNNLVSKTILPTGSADVNITIVTSAFTAVEGSDSEYVVTEKLNVIIYKNNVEVGILNLSNNEPTIEYEDGKYKDRYNDSLIVFNDVQVTYEKIENENQLKVNYKFNLTFDQDKYLSNADLYSMNNLDYELIFYPYTNIALKELSTSKYSFSIKPQSINQIYTAFYPSGQTTVLDEFNPQENSTEYIAPSRYGLLVINVYPKFNDADYYEVTVPMEYRQNITVTQMYAVYDNAESGSLLNGYISASPAALQLSDYRGVRLYNISNNFGKFDGNLYVRVLVTSSIPIGARIDLTVTAYKNGQTEPVADSAVCSLTVSPLPGITANIDGKTSEILLAKTFTKTGTIVATEFENEIAYEIISTKSSSSDYELSFTDTGFTITAKSSALGGDNITIKFSVSKNINGINEYSECQIHLKIVEYEILGVSVKDSSINGSNENQLDVLNGVTKQLNVSITANINRLDSNMLSSMYNLEKQFAGQGYVSTLVRSPNNWYRRLGYNADPYNDISLTITNNDSLVFQHYEFMYKNESYCVKATRISDVNILVLKASFYYDTNGIPRVYYSGLQTSNTIYELEFVFRLNIKDNSTYDHPNPVYSYEDIANMQSGSHYILMNDLTISDFVPFKASDFASFDGNGYIIKINNFDLSSYQGLTGTVNVGLFETISNSTIVKNLVLDVSDLLISNEYMSSLNSSSDSEYIASYLKINASNISNMNFGLIAGTNSGTITNVKIINTKETTSNYLYVYTTQSKIGTSTPSARIGGIVAQNSGNITNSFIGVNSSNETNSLVYIGDGTGDQGVVTTYPFRLCGSNNIAGITYSNSGKIISTYSNAVGVINTSLLGGDDSITAGFVGINETSGLISNAFVQGNNITNFRASEDYRIESKGNMGGFVYTNSGEIRDAYSNIAIKTNSKRSGGFVFENTTSGTIKNAYSTAKNSVGSRAHGAFIGTNEIGEINNQGVSGSLTSIYYLVVGDEYVNENEVATPIKSTGKVDGSGALGTSTADPFLYSGSFNGFSFSIGADLNSIWTYTNTNLGPQLISCIANDTYSNRELSSTDESVDTGDGSTVVYTYNYDYKTNVGGENTGYGDKNNPLVVRNGTEFVNFIINNSNAQNIFGGPNTTTSYVRLINDISLSDINLNEYKVDGKLLSEIIFNGILDGNNLSITGIKLLDNSKGTPKEEYGLFKQVGVDYETESTYNAVIKNVSFEIEQLVATNVKLVGTVAGKSVNTTYINVSVTGSTTIQGRDIVGGLTGIIAGNSTLIDVTSSVSATAVYRTQVSTVDLNPYFEYGFKIYDGNYENSLLTSVFGNKENSSRYRYNTLNNTILGAYSCDYGYVGGIAGIIDINNTDILDDSMASAEYNYLETAFDVGSGENRITSKYRTDEPTSPNVKNLKVYGNVVISGEHAGGLFGYVGDHTHIYDSKFVLTNEGTQEINGLHYSGGITAENHGVLEKVTVEHEKTVQAEYDKTIVSTGGTVGNIYLFKASKPIVIGGIVGYNQDAIIIDSYSKANVYNKNAYIAGGIIGYNKGYALMQHTYSTGLVYANYVIGGIIGYANESLYGWSGARNYPVASYDGSGKISAYSKGIGTETTEKIVLDYVVGLNTWNAETNKIIADNFRNVYSNTNNGETTYYDFTNAMPEIGNQYVEKMYKVIGKEIISGGGESQIVYEDALKDKVSKEFSSTDGYTYSYTKNIGSIIGRVSSIGVGSGTADYNVESLNVEKGGQTKNTFDVGILDIFNTSVIQSNKVNSSHTSSIKELEQKDVTVYSVKYNGNDVILSNDNIEKDEPYTKEYNTFNYYNYLGWQRDLKYVIGSNIEIDGNDPTNTKNIVQENVFNYWVSIATGANSEEEKVYKISEDTGLPEFIVGIYSNLIEISNETEWNANITNATSTRNKYYAITKDINLSFSNNNFGTFEGNLIGSKDDGEYPTITINISSLTSAFDLIKNAQITNIKFVIKYSSNNATQDYISNYDNIGSFTNEILNSNLTNTSISVEYNSASGQFITHNNNNIGGIFGKIDSSTFTITEDARDKVTYKVSNFSNWRISILQNNANKDVNFGLFAGYINNSKISYLPFDAGANTNVNIGVTNYKLNNLSVGGIIGQSISTSYPEFRLSTTQKLNVFVYTNGGVSVDNAYVGGIFGKVQSGADSSSGKIGKVAHVGSVYVGPVEDTNEQTATIKSIYTGGVIGYVNSITSINNISNGVVFDENATNKVDSKISNKIVVYPGSVNTLTAVGGLIGRISDCNLIGVNNSSGKAESANNAEIIVKNNNAPKANNYVGGIVGFVEGFTAKTEVEKVYNSGSITLDSTSNINYIGGIVGFANNVNIFECYNVGFIKVTNANQFMLGGILGAIGASTMSTAEVSNISYSISYEDFEVDLASSNARVGGIVGNNLFKEATKVNVTNTISMSRTNGTNDNNGFVQGIGNNVSVSGENYYVAEFATASALSGTSVAYGLFGETINTICGNSSEMLLQRATNGGNLTITPSIKDVYMFDKLNIANLDLSEGSKYNPQVITNSATISDTSIFKKYVVISSGITNLQITVPLAVAEEYTGLFASTNSTLITYTNNQPFVTSNSGILSGIKLNVTSNTNNSYLTQINQVSGIIYNCGIVGTVSNSTIQAPVAITNNGKILRTGVALVNKTSTFTSGSKSTFVLNNINGVIYESYSTMQTPNVVVPKETKIFGLIDNTVGSGSIKQTYFAGWYNNNKVNDGSVINSNNGVYYESQAVTAKGTNSADFFNSAADKKFTSPPWMAQGTNQSGNINFGYPVLDTSNLLYAGSLMLNTTYNVSGNDYTYNANGKNLIVSHIGMFSNMKSSSTYSYILVSNMSLNNTYSNSETSGVFKGNFNGLNKTITISAPMFASITQSEIKNINFVGNGSTLASVVASLEISDTTLSNISFEKCVTKDALITPIYTMERSASRSISDIIIHSGNSVGKSSKETLGAIISSVSGQSSSNRLTISNINTNKTSIKINNYATSRFGGLFGSISNVDISYSYYIDNIESSTTSYLGGIVGYATSSSIKNCYNYASITTTNKNVAVGGIVGGIESGSATAVSSISYCYNGQIGKANPINTKSPYCGGIVGKCSNNVVVEISNVINYAEIINNCDKGTSGYIGGIIGGAQSVKLMGTLLNNGKITIKTIDPSYIGGIAGSIATLTNSATLDSNGDIEITLTSMSDNELNKVKGNEFSWKLVNLLGKSECEDVWEGSKNYIKGTKKPAKIKEDNKIGLIVGNKSITNNIDTNSRKIIVNQKHVRYNVWWSTMYWHWGTKYINGVAFDINVSGVSYKSYYYYDNDSDDIYSDVSNKIKEASTMKNIDNRYQNGRPNIETAKDWQNKFENTTFYLSLF